MNIFRKTLFCLLLFPTTNSFVHNALFWWIILFGILHLLFYERHWYKFYFLWCLFRFVIKVNWFYKRSWGKSLMAQTVTNLPVMQETRVQSRGWEDPLEKGMATHSCILTWEFTWAEEPGRLQSMRSQRVRHNWGTNTFTFSFPFSCALEEYFV